MPNRRLSRNGRRPAVDEGGLHRDFDEWLEKLAPHEPVDSYRHNVGETNADAHMKRQLVKIIGE